MICKCRWIVDLTPNGWNAICLRQRTPCTRILLVALSGSVLEVDSTQPEVKLNGGEHAGRNPALTCTPAEVFMCMKSHCCSVIPCSLLGIGSRAGRLGLSRSSFSPLLSCYAPKAKEDMGWLGFYTIAENYATRTLSGVRNWDHSICRKRQKVTLFIGKCKRYGPNWN